MAFTGIELGSLACLLVGTPVERPNIVFIMADDLGYTDAGFAGSDFYETPFLDALAAQGVRFTQAYAAAANSAPSRACLLSGLYTPRHGIFTVSPSDRGDKALRKLIPVPNKDDLDTSFVTLAEVLQGRGYVCAQVGKWHLGDDADGSGTGPLGQGFAVNVAGCRAGTPYSYFYPYCNPSQSACHPGLEQGEAGEYLTDRLTREAIGFMESHQDQPFFLYLSHHAVHMPLKAPQEAIDPFLRKTPGQRHRNPVYAAMIAKLDESVGAVCRALDSLGLAQRTLVVFVSDNGGAMNVTDNYPLRGGKGEPYEGGTKVPLLMRWPGVLEAGAVCDQVVHGVDFYPTLAALAGASVPETLDGCNLLDPTLETSVRDLFWFMPAYLEAHAGMVNVPPFRATPYCSIRSGAWKMIHFFEDNHVELYNLEDDPGEQTDVAALYPQVAHTLHTKIIDWIAQTHAPLPTPVTPAEVR